MAKKTTKGSKATRRSRREVVIEENTTRVIPATRVVVRQEPVTLSRALGEAAVVKPVAAWRVTRTRRRRTT